MLKTDSVSPDAVTAFIDCDQLAHAYLLEFCYEISCMRETINIGGVVVYPTLKFSITHIPRISPVL